MKITIKRLDHVQICIPSNHEDLAREFYTELLGLTEIEKPDSLKSKGGLWYRVGDIELHIGVEDIDNFKSKRHPAFEITCLIEAREYLEENQINTFDENPISNVDRFTFYDPFGNRIEFLERK